MQDQENIVDETDNYIVDNDKRKVGDFLQDKIDQDSDLSVVSAYFSIYAFGELQESLNKVKRLRFLFGEPSSVDKTDPVDALSKAFQIDEDGGIRLKEQLKQKPLAAACAKWIDEYAEIRTIIESNFLHGKLYHIKGKDQSNTLIGSSNFTKRGLGFGAVPNLELNLEVRDRKDSEDLFNWFERNWNDEEKTKDVKEEVLAALNRLGHIYAPEFVYYKTLFHIFEDEIDKREETLEQIQLPNTEIWKRLYSFQKDGVKSVIKRLFDHNGCILADSVGLGKTWTALAVIKFFELRNERVLVLCPKRLESNWTRYTAAANAKNNPLKDDRLSYSVLAHTDLDRLKGKSGQVDLANFNWGGFDLVVIDESHNFRNETKNKKENGKLVKLSRYNRLLEDVIKDGSKTKVLMLSATPVNTTLLDLRNQIYLMVEKNQKAFGEIGVGNIRELFSEVEKEFKAWMDNATNKDKFLASLDTKFMRLLDAVTIARSRVHIGNYYSENDFGKFPRRKDPINEYPATDSENSFTYKSVNEKLKELKLFVYNPTEYLKDLSKLEEEKKKKNYDLRDSEKWLIGMIRVNLLKRLESSVEAFRETLKRIIGKMEKTIKAIDEMEPSVDVQPNEDKEDEDFVIGKKTKIKLAELNTGDWKNDILKDQEKLESLYNKVTEVTPDRDAKLATLVEILKKKLKDENPKALVFTTFSDTAKYLYKHICEEFDGDAQIGLVLGAGKNKCTVKKSASYEEILAYFAPFAQKNNATATNREETEENKEEIDILIATDCISEGQNLHDCDLVINYDIHWNPIRIMQRFGRIDRLGSKNEEITMINFWPTAELDSYLNLNDRVRARMAIANATATGDDDLLSGEDKESVEKELNFRNSQLERMKKEFVDIEDMDDNISMSDLTLDDFIADLLNYLRKNRDQLANAPAGIYALAEAQKKNEYPGVLFCLKSKKDLGNAFVSQLEPYFLLFVESDGHVRFRHTDAKLCLSLFRSLAVGQLEASKILEDAFSEKTNSGQNMEEYEKLLSKAIRCIIDSQNMQSQKYLFTRRDFIVPNSSELLTESKDFELITWLIIDSKQRSQNDVTTRA